MSAEMQQREEYGWSCADCGDGSDYWTDDDAQIELEIRDHNARNHA